MTAKTPWEILEPYRQEIYDQENLRHKLHLQITAQTWQKNETALTAGLDQITNILRDLIAATKDN